MRATIEDPANRIIVSPATHWEIAIKLSTGKYTLQVPFLTFVQEAIDDNGFTILPIEPRHTAELIPRLITIAIRSIACLLPRRLWNRCRSSVWMWYLMPIRYAGFGEGSLKRGEVGMAIFWPEIDKIATGYSIPCPDTFRALVLPLTEKTAGHQTHTRAAIWKHHLEKFLKETER